MSKSIERQFGATLREEQQKAPDWEKTSLQLEVQRLKLLNQGRQDALQKKEQEIVALEAALREKIEQAETDPLTRALNRFGFERKAGDLLAQVMKEARRLDLEHDRRANVSPPVPSQFNIALLDVDHFKNVNDTYGHDAGDKALKAIADVLRSSVREGDVVGRHGGEEFVVAFRTDGPGQSEPAAERLRNAIESLSFTYDGHDIPLRASIGVATFDPQQRTGPDSEASVGAGAAPDEREKTEQEKRRTILSRIIQDADKGVYAAKAKGRNQVVTAEAALQESSPHENVS